MEIDEDLQRVAEFMQGGAGKPPSRAEALARIALLLWGDFRRPRSCLQVRNVTFQHVFGFIPKRRLPEMFRGSRKMLHFPDGGSKRAGGRLSLRYYPPAGPVSV
jgi:hypothetical protein